jgi:molybdopterin synthase catalytic subunit
MSPEIVVRYFAPIRDATGRDEDRIELGAGSRLGDLLRLVAARYGVDERMITNCLVTVNGKGAAQLAGADTELHAGDRVSLLPPLSGG